MIKEKNSNISERFKWALRKLDVSPDENLLEIGCGTGILVYEIAGKLTAGTITAIDRSPIAIKKATKKNAEFIERGKVKLLVENFSENIPKEKYDKILAVNVSLFWKKSDSELEVLKSRLKKTSRFYLFFQPPNKSARETAELGVEKFVKAGFRLIEKNFREIEGVPAFCLIFSGNFAE